MTQPCDNCMMVKASNLYSFINSWHPTLNTTPFERLPRDVQENWYCVAVKKKPPINPKTPKTLKTPKTPKSAKLNYAERAQVYNASECAAQCAPAPAPVRRTRTASAGARLALPPAPAPVRARRAAKTVLPSAVKPYPPPVDLSQYMGPAYVNAGNGPAYVNADEYSESGSESGSVSDSVSRTPQQEPLEYNKARNVLPTQPIVPLAVPVGSTGRPLKINPNPAPQAGGSAKADLEQKLKAMVKSKR